jgi:large-conductance mechanosensitive channel
MYMADPGQRNLLRSRNALVGFLDFVRERGVTGLAIGFVLGSSLQKVVTAFVDDIGAPFVGLITGRADNLAKIQFGPFLVGDFVSTFISFLLLILVVYIFFKLLRLDRLEKPKS